MSEQHDDTSNNLTRAPFGGEVKRALESPLGQFLTWATPKLGWLMLLWVAWSAKSYMADFVEKSETIVSIKSDAKELDAKVVAHDNALRVQASQFAQMQVNQITISDTIKKTNELLQAMQVNQAVLDARLTNLERAK